MTLTESIHQHNVDVVTHALDWAQRGYAVFPLHSVGSDGKCTCGKSCGRDAGKHPRSQRGFHDATCDEESIRRWVRFPHPINYGIWCERLCVVDIDPRHAGDRSWLKLVRKNHDVHTWTVVTAGGGRHIFFAQPDDNPIKCKIGLVQGIDVKGTTGYVCGVGSLGASGKRYRFFPHCSPDDTPLIPPPKWLVELITTETYKPKPAGYYAKIADGVPNGSRNDTATTLAGRLFWAGLTYTQVVEYMLFWDTKNGPPTICEEHGEQYLIAIIDRVYARELRKLHARAQ
jgi:putative DNA primase/helicase